MVAGLAGELDRSDREFVDNLVPLSNEQVRGRLLRVRASGAIRGAL